MLCSKFSLFLFSSNGREYALVAEDHESMMVWILAMQVTETEMKYFFAFRKLESFEILN